MTGGGDRFELEVALAPGDLVRATAGSAGVERRSVPGGAAPVRVGRDVVSRAAVAVVAEVRPPSLALVVAGVRVPVPGVGVVAWLVECLDLARADVAAWLADGEAHRVGGDRKRIGSRAGVSVEALRSHAAVRVGVGEVLVVLDLPAARRLRRAAALVADCRRSGCG